MPSDITLAADLPAITYTANIGITHAPLKFELPASKNTDLIYGETFTPTIKQISLQANLPKISALFSLIPPTKAAFESTLPTLQVSSLVVRPSLPLQQLATLPDLTCTGECTYLSNTARPTIHRQTSDWQVGELRENGIKHHQQAGVASPAGSQAFWERAERVKIGVQHLLPPILRSMLLNISASSQLRLAIFSDTLFHHQQSKHDILLQRQYWQAARSIQTTTYFRHQDGNRRTRSERNATWQLTSPILSIIKSRFQPAFRSPKNWEASFQDAFPPRSGISTLSVVPTNPESSCYVPSGELLFELGASPISHLLFVCNGYTPPKAPLSIPIRKVYVVTNQANLYQLPSGTPIPALQFSISIDVDSWTWGFEALLPQKAESLISPTEAYAPVILLAEVNGISYKILAESLSRTRRFGETSLQLRGRGLNALLADPYAPILNFTNTELRTGQQLMTDVLSDNGVSMGWSLDWQLEDWNIPSNTFQYQGTRMEALTAIARSVGGYIHPDPIEQRLHVKHRYPELPWLWNTLIPEIILPIDVVTRESIRWRDRPSYNRVFVSGEKTGVLGQITRSGTAGDVLAPMVVDALITEVIAARQRGKAILADTQRQLEIDLKLPVFADTGVIHPGKYIAYQDGEVQRIGLVRGTQVDVNFADMWQTLSVQCYA